MNGTLRRRLGVLVAVALLPVAFGLAGRADVAVAVGGETVYGATRAEASFDWVTKTSSWTCRVQGYYAVSSGSAVHGNVLCDFSFWFEPERYSEGGTTLQFYGEGGCGGTTFTSAPLDQVNNWFYEAPLSDPSCAVTQVCFSWEYRYHGIWPSEPDDRSYGPSCRPFALGAPPVSTGDGGECPFGTPVQVLSETLHDSQYTHKNRTTLTIRDRNQYKSWRVQVIRTYYNDPPITGNTDYPAIVDNTVYTPPSTSPGVGGNWGDFSQWLHTSGGLANGADSDYIVKRPIAGVQVNMDNDSRVGTGLPDLNGYLVGQNDPTNCVFYFGKKIRTDNNPSTTLDDPNGPMSEVPPPAQGTEPPDLDPVAPEVEDACGTFSWTDPTTWASSGFCGVISVLLRLAEAVAAVPGAILNGLRGLLIPTGDGWDVAGLKAQMEAKPPFSLLGPMSDEASAFAAAYSGSGGCGVLANFEPDKKVTCAQVQAVGGMVGLYGLVQAGLISVTAWSMFLMVGRLFEEGQ